METKNASGYVSGSKCGAPKWSWLISRIVLADIKRWRNSLRKPSVGFDVCYEISIFHYTVKFQEDNNQKKKKLRRAALENNVGKMRIILVYSWKHF